MTKNSIWSMVCAYHELKKQVRMALGCTGADINGFLAFLNTFGTFWGKTLDKYSG
jgi:hypothetical protein